MRVYLIRHGKSEEDSNGRRQYPHSKLAEVGLDQARRLSDKLSGSKFDHIYSSTWERAKQTAEIVANKLGMELDLHPHIHEVEAPDELYGIDKDSELNRQFVKELKENIGNPDWKFLGGGESLNDVINRAEKFKDELIAKHIGHEVLVFTHGVFINALLSVMIWGKKLPRKNIRPLLLALHQINTSMTVVEYDEEGGFRVMRVNDHSHLD